MKKLLALSAFLTLFASLSVSTGVSLSLTVVPSGLGVIQQAAPASPVQAPANVVFTCLFYDNAEVVEDSSCWVVLDGTRVSAGGAVEVTLEEGVHEWHCACESLSKGSSSGKEKTFVAYGLSTPASSAPVVTSVVVVQESREGESGRQDISTEPALPVQNTLSNSLHESVEGASSLFAAFQQSVSNELPALWVFAPLLVILALVVAIVIAAMLFNE